MQAICQSIVDYLRSCQVMAGGEFYGSFWSEKAYHAPLLDWHGGGAHHHRGAGSGGLGLYLTGEKDAQYRAEQAFDWLVARQNARGGWTETQNNDRPSDWEYTGAEELSTIETAFASRGLASALRAGLPPKASYLTALRRAGLWFVGMETPAWSGVFPHHERSPYDTPNATLHSVEALGLIYHALRDGYGIRVNIFRAAAFRGLRHALAQQRADGCVTYRSSGGVTINYTALVLYLAMNFLELWTPEDIAFEQIAADDFLARGGDFLAGAVQPDGLFKWDELETTCARHNVWTYALVWNVLRRLGRAREAGLIADRLRQWRSADGGLLPMRDVGEPITRCAFMQADMLLFLRG